MTTYFNYLPEDIQKKLKCNANELFVTGKGILAADESEFDMESRFKKVGLPNTEQNRRKYRQVIFSTDRRMSEYISAVIVQHETLNQKSDDGAPLLDLIRIRGINMCINVDRGLVPLLGSENEYTTQGLDNLATRCQEYKKAGIKYAKWRVAMIIDKNTPSLQAMQENAIVAANYAAICQEHELVPIVQPEVLALGDHDLERTQKVTEAFLAALFKSLNDFHVYLEGSVIQPNMVIPGLRCKKSYTAEEIALATLQSMRRTVPPAVAGISFLSGGQTEEEATVHLNFIKTSKVAKPWKVTFTFGGALYASALNTWAGKEENIGAAQNKLIECAWSHSLASQGEYIPKVCNCK